MGTGGRISATQLPASLGPARVPKSCLHPQVLPASPHPACIPGSCLCPRVLPAPAHAPVQAVPRRWPGAPWGLPSMALFSPCHPCEWQDPHPAGGERMGGKGAITPHPSSVGWQWWGLESGRQRPKPLDSLFLARGCLWQSPCTHDGISCRAMRGLSQRAGAGEAALASPSGVSRTALPKSPPLTPETGRAVGLRSGRAFRSAGRDSGSLPGRGAEGQGQT